MLLCMNTSFLSRRLPVLRIVVISVAIDIYDWLTYFDGLFLSAKVICSCLLEGRAMTMML